MTADRCAQIIIKAALNRRRESILPPGKLALWLKLLAPGMLDQIIVDRFLRPAASRVAREKEEAATSNKTEE
jgi:hypothetical protein